jgi:hypothetical protein
MPLRLLGALAATVLLALGSKPAVAATTLIFSDFSNTTGLVLNGDSAVVGVDLRLTPSQPNRGGSTFTQDAIDLGPDATFSTAFSFRISNGAGFDDPGGGIDGADGIAFVLQTVNNSVGAVGAGLGYAGIQPSLAIEFDTFRNTNINDPDGNHMGISENGDPDSVLTAGIAEVLNDGSVYHAWADYDGATLEVRFASTASRPPSPGMSYAIDLASLLGTEEAFVGFTASTGNAFNDHDIVSWQFVDAFQPIPEPSSALLVGGGLIAISAFQSRRAPTSSFSWSTSRRVL